jgi:hypothetical protein
VKARGNIYEPWEVGVGELLLTILPPLVPVVIRCVSVRGPGALIFHDDLFFTKQELKRRHHETEIYSTVELTGMLPEAYN